MRFIRLFGPTICRNINTATSQQKVMVVPKALIAEIQRRREDATSRQGGYLNNASIQILESSSKNRNPSLMVQSEGRTYLFNCSEGFQRMCYANRIKLTNLENVFLTQTDWSKVAGIYGLSLTLQDLGIPKLTVNSTDNLEALFTSARTFLNLHNGPEDRFRNISDIKFYEDPGANIRGIVIGTKDVLVDQKRRRAAADLVAYLCELPDLPGGLDARRCKELKVPIGPKLGLLKSGKDVKLDDGTIVRSADVCGPTNRGPRFLIIDCPSTRDIGSFLDNAELSRLRMGQDGVIDLVVHLSPSAITDDPSYRQWMIGFPQDCRHILTCSAEPKIPNCIDSYRLQYLMNKLDSQLFPEMHLPCTIRHTEDKASNEAEPKIIFLGNLKDQHAIIEGSTFDRFSLRPNQIHEAIETAVNIAAFHDRAKLEVGFEEELTIYERAIANLSEPAHHEPEVVFLGTGSALPSKLRNTSCILINFTAPSQSSILLDCGEDSYGQLVRFYGSAGSETILRNLAMIYISHHHADHHIGLLEILRHRSKIGCEPILLLIPDSINEILNYYNENFENLDKTYRIINTGGLMRGAKLAHDQRPKLLRDLTVIGVDHCYGSCAAVFEFHINRPDMKTFRLAYSGDTRPSDDFARIGTGCDLLIHEATFDHRDQASAISKKHCTTDEAIGVAKKMGAKFTILTHFSQRYPKIPYFTEDFDDTIGFAFDNMAVRCPSQLRRIPLMKDLLKVVFAKSIGEIDERHRKMSIKSSRVNTTKHQFINP